LALYADTKGKEREMTIDKAIDKLSRMRISCIDFYGTGGKDAIELGIVALKEVARVRRLGPPLKGYHLPGETEE
jgi:hypothetical protein